MKQIFIVEDDQDIRELIEFLLLRMEYSVQSFPTAEEFKTGITAEIPDLILLDIMLPDGNGLEICRGLCAAKETRHIPIVLMSAHTTADVANEPCARDFIPKPFNIDDLLHRVGKQLEYQ